MHQFSVPSTEQVSSSNQVVFETLKKGIGYVPNLYAVFAYSESALVTFMSAQSMRTHFSPRQREAINLVVSEVNGCAYCLSAHTVLALQQKLTEEQILEIRSGQAPFDPKMDALVKIVKAIVVNKGHIASQLIDQFFDAGFQEGDLIDAILLIGLRTMTNQVFALTNVPIDWPLAPALPARPIGTAHPAYTTTRTQQ